MELYTLEWHVDYEGDGVLGIFSSEKEARDALLEGDGDYCSEYVTINCYKFGQLYDSSASYHNEVTRFGWDFDKKKWKEVE